MQNDYRDLIDEMKNAVDYCIEYYPIKGNTDARLVLAVKRGIFPQNCDKWPKKGQRGIYSVVVYKTSGDYDYFYVSCRQARSIVKRFDLETA